MSNIAAIEWIDVEVADKLLVFTINRQDLTKDRDGIKVGSVLLKHRHERAHRFLIDVSSVEIMSLEVMRKFCALAMTHGRRQGKVIFCGLRYELRRTLLVTPEFESMFDFFSTKKDALRALRV